MIHTSNTSETQPSKPILPAWIMNAPASKTFGSKTLENAGFASGSALALLHVALNDPNIAVPTELLRNRLALRAAVQCLKIEGRSDDDAQVRDAFLLTKSGDIMGPGGDMLALWSKACTVSLRSQGWQDRLMPLIPKHVQEHMLQHEPDWLGEGSGNASPIARAAQALSLVLNDFPREETIGLLLADVALARALGWSHLIPLMALHMKRRQLNSNQDELLLACHWAIAGSSQDATRLVHDLARRAGRLRAIAPKLRARGSDEAVQLFLTEDAVLPSSMLSPKIQGTNVKMTDRAARRFCDRLVELGVVREITGRSTFRLYGI
ncbi:MAG: DUF1403 family protein [Oleispira sp.]|nr:DUF1403 family protein [Oleispira sp.]